MKTTGTPLSPGTTRGDALLLAKYKARRHVSQCRARLVEVMGDYLIGDDDQHEFTYPAPTCFADLETYTKYAEPEEVAEMQAALREYMEARTAHHKAQSALYRYAARLAKAEA